MVLTPTRIPSLADVTLVVSEEKGTCMYTLRTIDDVFTVKGASK